MHTPSSTPLTSTATPPPPSTIAIIGGGAAGCFAAIHIKRWCPEADVVVCEAASRLLAKVAITGGGRCNLTNTFVEVSQQNEGLKSVYPRGDKLMRRALSLFSERDTWRWFEDEGVRLVAQDDQCVFPVSQDAMQIVRTLLRAMEQSGVRILTRHRVGRIEPTSHGYTLHWAPAPGEGEQSPLPLSADRVLVTAGGQPRAKGFEMLAPLALRIESPAPSLFTFNLSGDWHKSLMGIVVERAVVTLAGTRLKGSGPLLLTHWGMSGPAILRLSSYAARLLAERDYRGTLVVNWIDGANDEDARSLLARLAADNPRKQVTSTPPPGLTSRLWQGLIERSGLNAALRWNEVSGKLTSRLVTVLTADEHHILSRCAFKDEFVTCGGVSLKEVNPSTMECRRHPGLYFAGEVLDIDALTGGFNLQAAWSTGYTAARSIAEALNAENPR